MSLKDFQIIVCLGEGAYSSVYKVKRNKDNKQYALKKVKILGLSEKEKQNALNQVRILASINHPNIIAYKEAFLDELSNSLCIVMQYADDGDLYQKINEHKKKQSYFKQTEIWNIFIQIVKGLKALHKAKILHRDLKSANVFLCKNGQAKLGDMNVSKVSQKGLCQTQTGTPYYASPQVWKDLPYDNKSDIWSLGCVTYEMTTLKPPFRSQDMQGLYKKVVRGLYPRIPVQFSTDLSNVIRSMLQLAPEWRPTTQKILSMSSVVKRMGQNIAKQNEYQEDTILLNTIKIPRNMIFLGKQLPKPNYQEQKKQKKKQHKTMNNIEPQIQDIVIPASNSIQKLRSHGSKGRESQVRIVLRPRQKSVGLLPIINKLPPIKK